MLAASSDVPRGFWAVCVGVFFVGVGLRLALSAGGDAGADGPRSTSAGLLVEAVRPEAPAVRNVAVYGGLGVWVDAFDFSPAYQNGGVPPVTPEVVEDWSTLGVETVYLQAARADERAPGRLLEEDVLAEFLLRSHAHGIRVVGWYLPTFVDVDADLDHLLAIADFSVLGHRFDGVAVDIEFVAGVADHGERSARLVSLSNRLRDARTGEALGAIVPPPVQMEVINPAFWPRFPWRDLDPAYDVWLPMTYWTTRSEASGYRDAYTYTEESTRRMRNNLGRPDTVVHPIGGIGDETELADLGDFRRALLDTGAIGGSIYDWNSLPVIQRAALSEMVPR